VVTIGELLSEEWPKAGRRSYGAALPVKCPGILLEFDASHACPLLGLGTVECGLAGFQRFRDRSLGALTRALPVHAYEAINTMTASV
jgi:hypothetical protein